MTTNYNNTPMKDLANMPGIVGLRTAAKVKFVRALQAEERGEYPEAQKLLEEAVKAEEAEEIKK